VYRWDRQPFVTKFGIPKGEATAHMIPRNISHNFLVANYGGGNGGATYFFPLMNIYLSLYL
jgi:hypothetical protein